MKLYGDDEIALMLQSAEKQECKDKESNAATERFMTILESLQKDCRAYIQAAEQALIILQNKHDEYAAKNQSTWDNL